MEKLQLTVLDCGAVLQFYPVCDIGRFIDFGLGTIRCESTKGERVGNDMRLLNVTGFMHRKR